MVRRFVLLVLIVGLSSVPAVAGKPIVEYVPTCPAPQPITGLQPVGASNVQSRTPVAWNGQDYGALYVDNQSHRLIFRRMFADGTPTGPEVIVSDTYAVADPISDPGIVWNGTGYGVAWLGEIGTTSIQVYFARLDASGSIIGSERRVSLVDTPDPPDMSIETLVVAWSGQGYALAWSWIDGASGLGRDVYATLLDSDGSIAGSGTLHDIPIASAPEAQERCTIAWSSALGYYLVAWEDSRVGYLELRGALLSLTGQVLSERVYTTTGFESFLVGTESGYAMFWSDARGDNGTEIYMARISPVGVKIGDDIQLTNNPANSYRPMAVWTGAEYGVFWFDDRGGNNDIWFQRVSGSGVPLGGNVQITSSNGLRDPFAAFAYRGYLVTFAPDFNRINYSEALGCAADSTPPTCPGNLLAYNVTGTTATISWLPSQEDLTDIAYYQVYRNNAPLAKTSSTLYADSGLSLNTTYNYAVQPVNAAQLMNGSCTTSLYVKTNASLVLTVNKDEPDALLTWTDSSLNNYNVFRGTSPQVMQLIGSSPGQSFSDPNVLRDNVLYFYTVDEPGL